MKKDVGYYLSKGFDRKMAEYFVSGRRTVVDVEPKENFTLIITFDNDEKRILDMNMSLKPGTVFEKISRWEDFRRVYIDKEKSIAWDIDPNIDSEIDWMNKIDLCPDTCYVDSVPMLEK